MRLELRSMVKGDAREAIALLLASYWNNAFTAIVLPTGFSQATIDKLVDARQKAADDPDQFALKVIDTEDNDKIVGSAVWVYTKAMTDEDWEKDEPKVYPESRTDILTDIIAKEMGLKRKILGHTRWLELDALHTLPTYQRRGVGSMLMKWGTDKLEEMKVPGFIISSDQGYGLYLKHGFKEVDRWEVDMNQWSPGKGMYKNVFLTRFPLGYAASPSKQASKLVDT